MDRMDREETSTLKKVTAVGAGTLAGGILFVSAPSGALTARGFIGDGIRKGLLEAGMMSSSERSDEGGAPRGGVIVSLKSARVKEYQHQVK